MKKLFVLFLTSISIFITANGLHLAKANSSLSVKSKSAILMSAETGEVIFAHNECERLTIASMTKIMLLNLCFEGLDSGTLKKDEQITVSKTASGMGGSQVFLEANAKYKAEDLIKSVIIASANDASVALAEKMYGSEGSCVDAMNAKCREWGLKDTLFSNCTGLPKPTQYSSAKDVAIMLQRLFKHKEYFNYSSIWMDEITHPEGRVTGLTNTNKLVKFYDGCDGGKTGYTAESGFCLASTAKRGELRLISVVIKSPDSKTRFNDSSTMLNYGFENFTNKMVVDSSKPLDIKVEINKSKKSKIEVLAQNDVFIFSKRNTKENVRVDFEPLYASAPLKKGDKVGELIIFKNNVEYQRVAVVTNEDVSKKTYFDYIRDVTTNW